MPGQVDSPFTFTFYHVATVLFTLFFVDVLRRPEIYSSGPDYVSSSPVPGHLQFKISVVIATVMVLHPSAVLILCYRAIWKHVRSQRVGPEAGRPAPAPAHSPHDGGPMRMFTDALSFVLVFSIVFVLAGLFLMPYLPPIPERPVTAFEWEFWSSNWAGLVLGLAVAGLNFWLTRRRRGRRAGAASDA